MALQVETGQFAANTGGTTTTVSTGFQPKAIIIWTDGKITADGTDQSGASWAIGFSDGINNTHISWAGDDAVATTNAGRGSSTNLLRIFSDGTPTIPTGGTLNAVAFNSTNFVCTFGGIPSSAWLINYIIFGGDDITNAFVGQDTIPLTATTQSYTNVGFQGDVIFFLTDNKSGSGNTTGANWALGMAISSTKRWVVCGGARDSQTTSAAVNGQTALFNNACVADYASAASGSIVTQADFTQFTSTGFDLNFSLVQGSANNLAYMVIKGGTWNCGVSTKPTTATTQSITGQEDSPKMVALAITSATTTDGTITAESPLCFGAGTSSSSRAYAGAYHNDAINTIASSYAHSSKILRDKLANIQADLTSLNSDGWTITWDGTGTALKVPWFTAANGSTLVNSSLVIIYEKLMGIVNGGPVWLNT